MICAQNLCGNQLREIPLVTILFDHVQIDVGGGDLRLAFGQTRESAIMDGQQVVDDETCMDTSERLIRHPIRNQITFEETFILKLVVDFWGR